MIVLLVVRRVVVNQHILTILFAINVLVLPSMMKLRKNRNIKRENERGMKMKVTRLIVENVLKLKLINIVPKSDIIEIKGENMAGKSSVLNALVIGFKGKKAAPVESVRHGEKKGSIIINLDGDLALGIPPFKITSKVTNDKIDTIIEPVELLKGETPRSFLDKLLGVISFDPQEFIQKEPKEQRKILMKLIGVDGDALKAKEDIIFNERTEIGRDLKSAKSRCEKLQSWPDVKETQEIKVGELSTKLTKAMNWNQDIKNRESANEKLKNIAIINKGKIESVKEQIQSLQTELEHLELLLANQKKEFITERDAIAELEPLDISAINLEIQEIETTNSHIRNNITYQTEHEVLDAIQTKYDDADTRLDTLRTENLAIIQNTKLPVPGLSFDDDGLLHDGILFNQCSDSEKLMIGVGISMALNPTVKIVRMSAGSLIGPKNKKILEDIITKYGFQLFLESVAGKDEYNKTGQVGIFIEEGYAVSENGVDIDNTPEPPKPAAKGKSAPASAPNPVTEPDW